MNTFTKEQLIEKLQHRISVASGFSESEKAQIDLELARIALASLEAEAVEITDYMAYAFHNALSDSSLGADEVEEIKDGLRAAFANVTAPPAPANAEPVAWLWSHRKHPSEVSLVRPEDDERAEGAHWSGWNCQALYAEQVTTACKLPELTDSQCLEFLAVAFRHARIKGDIEFDDIRLGLKMALEAAPQQEVKSG